MLLQSSLSPLSSNHSPLTTNMTLLPALPQAWQDGEVSGLCARGGYTVDMVWQAGKVSSARITSKTGGKLIISLNGKTKTIYFKPGQTKTLK